MVNGLSSDLFLRPCDDIWVNENMINLQADLYQIVLLLVLLAFCNVQKGAEQYRVYCWHAKSFETQNLQRTKRNKHSFAWSWPMNTFLPFITRWSHRNKARINYHSTAWTELGHVTLMHVHTLLCRATIVLHLRYNTKVTDRTYFSHH